MSIAGPPPSRTTWGVGALAVPLVVALTAIAAPVEAAEPAVGSSTVVPIQVTGDPSERFSLVVLGDGYTAEEMPEFRAQVQQHLNVMWSIEPYKSYRDYFNVYAVEIVSGESGVSCDRTLDAPRRDTPLGMAFWSGCRDDGIERLLTMDDERAAQYAATAPEADQILALANSDTYGGAGGAYATASGGNALSALISPHEIGHSLGGLDDEYDYYTRGETTGDYDEAEPESAHHTLLTEQEMLDQQAKWFRWLGEPSESGGTIGRFEGGQYFSTGIWRPSRHSIMKTLGYQYDQVGREVMTERVSSKVPLVPRSADGEAPVPADSVLWVETAHPGSHELDVTWRIDGVEVTGTENSRDLDLADLGLSAGDEVSATVVDDTEFVRDPALRASPSMTQERTWIVGGDAAAPNETDPEIIQRTQTDYPVGADTVLYVETSHPSDRILDVEWTVDGVVVADPDRARNLDLGDLDLPAGTHTVTATVSDPAVPGTSQDSVSWTVDAAVPTVGLELSEPLEVTVGEDGEPHYTFEESFSMKLDPADDQDGYVVGEFRLDGDGWHNYYGWPTDADAPFLFTPTGTNIDDLIYGNLGSGGMSLSPFQEREPGYGTHRIEYRSTDAAGNTGEVTAFTVTVVESDDTTEPTAPVPPAPAVPGTGVGSDGELAATGPEVFGTVAGGSLLLLVGTALVIGRRRRLS